MAFLIAFGGSIAWIGIHLLLEIKNRKANRILHNLANEADELVRSTDSSFKRLFSKIDELEWGKKSSHANFSDYFFHMFSGSMEKALYAKIPYIPYYDKEKNIVAYIYGEPEILGKDIDIGDDDLRLAIGMKKSCYLTQMPEIFNKIESSKSFLK